MRSSRIKLLVYFLIGVFITTIGCSSSLLGCKVAPIAETTVQETTSVEMSTEVTTAEEQPSVEKSFWQMVQDRDLDFSGVTINVLTQGGMPYDDYLDYCAAEFEKLTGAKVVFDRTPWESLMPKLVNDVTTGANRIDVLAADIEFQYGLYNYMENLYPYIDKYNVDMEGFFSAIYQCGEWLGKGIRLSIPFYTPTTLNYVIRTDIFDGAGIKYPFDTWEDYYSALAKVHDQAHNVYGVSFAGVSAQLVKKFLVRLWTQQVDLLSRTWAPQANTPEAVKACEMMVDLVNYAPPGVLGWDLPDAASAFLNGDTAVFEESYALLAGLIDNPDESKIVGKWTIIPTPAGGPAGNFVQQGGVLMKGSENKDAAFCFIAFFTATENQVYWASQEVEGKQKGFTYPRKQAWEQVLLPKYPQLQGLYDALEAGGIPFTPGLPQWLEAFMAVGEECGEAMAGTLTPQEAMDKLQQRLEGIIQTAVPPYEYPYPFEK
ncbi:MAG: extracellular solute-binding protein [Actinobacteria bacterium]|nr:extracellular solute-binding protein [Actinomycetota bacterium]